MKNIFVTGGLGFIGSALVRLLHNDLLNNIIIIDSKTYASNPIALELFKHYLRVTMFNISITDKLFLKKLVNFYKPSRFYHLAAESHVDNSISGPDVFIDTNIMGTYNILQIVKQYLDLIPEMKESFRFLYVSTDEVYGDLQLDLPQFTEESNYKPSSPYSASKCCGLMLVRAWGRTYNLPIIITHCGNNYGPYQHPLKLVPKTIINILKQQPIPVYGSGTNIRDWIYVLDHVNGLITAMLNGLLQNVYNIGTNKLLSNVLLVLMICKTIQNKYDLPYDPTQLITYVNDRPGHDFRYGINNSKLKQLNWRGRYNINVGLHKTIQWYKNNLDKF